MAGLETGRNPGGYLMSAGLSQKTQAAVIPGEKAEGAHETAVTENFPPN